MPLTLTRINAFKSVCLNADLANYRLIRVSLINDICDASQWRPTWSRTTDNGSSATRVFHSDTPGVPLGSSTRYPGAPLPLCSYIIRGLVVVDRTRGACLVTCSSGHLTSCLSHSYISTTHSLRPQACVFFSSVFFSVSQATSLGF